MEIHKKINNSPSFLAIKISSKEGRKVADEIRNIQKTPNNGLKEQLMDIFKPHIEREAELHADIIKEDFIQDMYLCLFENIEKVNRKHHPSADLVKKLNELQPTIDNYATMGHKSFESLTQAEKELLIHEENLLEMYDAQNIIKKAGLTKRSEDVLLWSLEGLEPDEIGKRIKLTSFRVIQVINNGIRMLHRKRKYKTPATDVVNIKIFDPK